MKITKYLLLSLIIFSLSCEDQWDGHFNDNEIKGAAHQVSDENLLDYLKTKSEFSEFVKAIEEDTTGLAHELRSDQILTVWALNNEAMQNLDAVAQETGFSRSFILRFHVNNLSYGLSKLKPGLRLISLNGKYISVINDPSGGYLVGGAGIMDGDQFCANGVVHEINDVMTPQLSIYEYLNSLGEEYSIIKDTLFALNEVVFDRESSTPIGVDKTGNTIYDSAFVIQNDILDSAGVTSEFLQSTVFIPSNEVIQATFDELNLVIPDMTMEDTLKAMNWIKRALFFDEVVDNYGAEEDIPSAFGRVWRTTVQEINPEPLVMSNGLVYELTYLHVPNNIMLSRFKELVSYYEFLPDSLKNSLYTITGATNYTVRTADNVTFDCEGAPATWTYKVFYAEGDLNDNVKLAVEFTAIRRVVQSNGTTSAEPVYVPPGKYIWSMGFWSKNQPYVNFYFNDELIKGNVNVEPSTPWNYDRVNNTVCGKWDGDGGPIGEVTVTGDGPQTFKIKVEFEQPQSDVSVEDLKIYHWALRASEDNY